MVAVLLAAAIWGRLFYWQVMEHDSLSARAEGQYTVRVDLPATRGVIFDRDMRPLVVNTTAYSVFVAPDQVPPAQRGPLATQLSVTLGIPRDRVAALLESDTKFAYVARRIPKEKADELRRLQLRGVGLIPEPQRSYIAGGTPETSLAANLLGFVSYGDGTGKYGIESYYEDQLSGAPGHMYAYRDLAGREIVLGPQARRDPVNGSNLVLTLDSNIQFAAEKALAEGVRRNKAESGSVLIMDPKTGGIIAWADYPSYNANNFAQADLARLRDPIIADLYEPGSVMKVPTLAGALDNHAITPDLVINDPGSILIGGCRLHDWNGQNRGNVNMTTVLQKSLNVGAITAMQKEGPQAFYNNLINFGFAEPSGVDVAGEQVDAGKGWSGLPPLSQWRLCDLATTAYGQGINVNMVQMLAAINVIANRGKYAQPHVVERIGSTPSPFSRQPQRQAISPETAAQMTRMMEQVVQDPNTGFTQRIPNFEKDQAGKTGTAQIFEKGEYSLENLWASYVGFLPSDNPKFTMLVVIRKPHNEGCDNKTTLCDHNEGYYVSAPIWREIAQAMISQWRITPDPR
jgi:cell division protein FtsI/penicillin-binding protein 2